MKIDSAIKLDSSMAAANSPASLTDTIPAQAAMLKTDTDQEPGAQAGGSGRTIENDLYALNVKAEIGGPAAAGSGIVLSSATTKPPAGAPAPQVMRDFPNEITTFLKETVPNAVQKFDGAMQEASLVINGDLTPAEYARASNGGRSVQKLLQQVKHFEGEAEALLQAGRKLKADTAAAEGLHRGWSVSENLKGEALKGSSRRFRN
jgi:hypothetical protein